MPTSVKPLTRKIRNMKMYNYGGTHHYPHKINGGVSVDPGDKHVSSKQGGDSAMKYMDKHMTSGGPIQNNPKGHATVPHNKKRPTH